jgi:aspartyl-tRNA(Asn)/glutamyl-tRNA(Gln) amidotransferase subunit C
MDVSHIAKLANIPLTSDEKTKFIAQFADTLKTINVINELDTSHILPTSQVTGLLNVFRQDEVDSSRVLSQDQALSQASQTYKGFFAVPLVIDYE